MRNVDSLIENIVLKENAQFYKKDASEYYSDYRIQRIFSEVSSDRQGQYLLNVRKYVYEDDRIEFSLCVFKIVQQPSFIVEHVNGWLEHRIGYCMLFDLGDYVVVFKKNVASSDLLFEGLTEVQYKILSTIFVEDDTVVEKVSLNNTSTLPDAMAKKVYEANNLRRSMSTYGLGKYVANSLRVNNLSEKTSVVFNTSRISTYSDKRNIYELTIWVNDIIEKIRAYTERETFVDVFAEPVEYEDVYLTLTPISILISPSSLLEDFENGIISHVVYNIGGRSRELSLNKVSKVINQVFTIENVRNGDSSEYFLKSDEVNDIEVLMNRKSITLKSKKASNLNVIYSDGPSQSLIQYLNRQNDYVINFENLELVYFQRKLFKDRGLLNTVESFLNVFIPVVALETVTSEKGNFTESSTSFSADSIFHYVDASIAQISDYAFLDDLGDEWADFITINDNKLSFIHAKHKSAFMSATAFQDVVAQALKNIGNFKPSIERIQISKLDSWSTPYQINGVRTNIDKLRKGVNLSDGVSHYTNLLNNPNLQREIIIVVDFISKRELQGCLEQLRNGEYFSERNQVIQILWLISGLINCCMENGIGIYIHCKP